MAWSPWRVRRIRSPRRPRHDSNPIGGQIATRGWQFTAKAPLFAPKKPLKVHERRRDIIRFRFAV
jgi:hypothetical protein